MRFGCSLNTCRVPFTVSEFPSTTIGSIVKVTFKGILHTIYLMCNFRIVISFKCPYSDKHRQYLTAVCYVYFGFLNLWIVVFHSDLVTTNRSSMAFFGQKASLAMC